MRGPEPGAPCLLSLRLLSLPHSIPQPQGRQPESGMATAPLLSHQAGLSSLNGGEGGKMLPQVELGQWGWHLLTPPPPTPPSTPPPTPATRPSTPALHPPPFILPHTAPPPHPRHIDFWFLGFVAPSPELPNSSAVVTAHTQDCLLCEEKGSQVLLDTTGTLGEAASV